MTIIDIHPEKTQHARQVDHAHKSGATVAWHYPRPSPTSVTGGSDLERGFAARAAQYLFDCGLGSADVVRALEVELELDPQVAIDVVSKQIWASSW